MVLIIAPAIDGLKQEWREAAENMGASPRQYWRRVALPILMPSILGTMILLFGNAFGAQATAYQLTGGTIPLVTIVIGAQISGDVLHNPGLGYAMAMGMVVIMAVSIGLYRAPAVLRAVAAADERWPHRSTASVGRQSDPLDDAVGSRLVDRLPDRRPLLLPAADRHVRSSRCEAEPAVRRPTRNSFADPQFFASLFYSLRGRDRHDHRSAWPLIVPTAYWVRLRLPRLRPIVEFVTLLPFVIPPVVLVFGLIRVVQPTAVAADPYRHRQHAPARRGYVVLSLPYMYRAVDTGLRSIDVRTPDRGGPEPGRGLAHDPARGSSCRTSASRS